MKTTIVVRNCFINRNRNAIQIQKYVHVLCVLWQCCAAKHCRPHIRCVPFHLLSYMREHCRGLIGRSVFITISKRNCTEFNRNELYHFFSFRHSFEHMNLGSIYMHMHTIVHSNQLLNYCKCNHIDQINPFSSILQRARINNTWLTQDKYTGRNQNHVVSHLMRLHPCYSTKFYFKSITRGWFRDHSSFSLTQRK